MSGIVGMVNADGAPIDRDLLARLTAFLEFRGPDAQALWAEGCAGLGHTLFRTTDESAIERQPMSLDGDVWITGDVRVDGHADLRRKLEDRRNLDLQDATDIELILHAYGRWGTGCVKDLIGDFAFAIWDRRKKTLFCARDHVGVKPFFYARAGNALVFSNTLDCLRLHPSVTDRLNDVAIGDFLLFAQNQDPSTTTFADIQRLPAAHTLVFSRDGLRIDRYWSLPADGHIRYKRASDYVDRFTEVLRTAVDDRLRTSNVAVEMSGGLDSPAIAATAKDILLRRGKPFDIQAHTFVYDRLIPDRERHFSGLVAKSLAIPINYTAGDDYPLFESTPNTTRPVPEPFYLFQEAAATADYYTTVARQSRVVLTGWDGDAILSDSPRLYVRELLKTGRFGEAGAGLAWFVRVARRLPRMGIRRWIKRKLGTYPVPSTYPSWIAPSFERSADLRARWAWRNAERPPVIPTRPQASEDLLVPNWWELFEGYDAGVTGNAIEARHPFTDRRLVDYVLAIPPVPWAVSKNILRVAMTGVLPEAVLLRRKAGLAGHPNVEMLRGARRHWLDEFHPAAGLSNYVRREAIPAVGGETDSASLWINLRPFRLNRWLETGFPFAAATRRPGAAQPQTRCFGPR